MLFLLLSALCSAVLVLVFKAFEKWGVNVWQGVTFNYVTCVITGIIVFLSRGYSVAATLQGSLSWLYPTILLGLLFFTGFSLSGFSTQKAGVTVTALAAKMSLIVPVLFNVLFMADNRLSLTAYAGIVLTFPALWLASAKPKRFANRHSVAGILLPILVFLAGGTVDTLVNWANSRLYNEQQQALFTTASFGAAGLFGIIFLIIRMITEGERINLRGIAGGITLGVPNYFSVYLLLQALSAFNNNGAWLFPFYNIVIILTAATASSWIFGEKLTRTNWLGLATAVLALTLLAV